MKTNSIITGVFLFLINFHLSGQAPIKGTLWNIQGTHAGAWDLVKDSEKFILDSDKEKDLINQTSKRSLPDFEENW